jgi:hypothetical protein
VIPTERLAACPCMLGVEMHRNHPPIEAALAGASSVATYRTRGGNPLVG